MDDDFPRDFLVGDHDFLPFVPPQMVDWVDTADEPSLITPIISDLYSSFVGTQLSGIRGAPSLNDARRGPVGPPGWGIPVTKGEKPSQNYFGQRFEKPQWDASQQRAFSYQPKVDNDYVLQNF